METKVYEGIDGLFEALSDLTIPTSAYMKEYKKLKTYDPEKYDIVEKKNAKLNRIKNEIERHNGIKTLIGERIDEYNKELLNANKKIRELEKELKELED